MPIVLNKEGGIFTDTLEMETIICYSCAIPFAVPKSYKSNLQANQNSFYCPNGHSQSYITSTETILKRKMEKLEKERESERKYFEDTLFNRNKMIQENKIEIIVLKRKNTIKRKKLERVKNGVCPCCNRTFQDLMTHMKTQHPESL